jgi:hypothetical protein
MTDRPPVLTSYEVTRTSHRGSTTTSAASADLQSGELKRSLREVRPGVLTEITVTPDNPETRRWVLDRLVVQQSSAETGLTLADVLDEVAESDNAPASTLDLIDELWEAQWRHNTDCALGLNGRPVIAQSVSGRQRPALLRVDSDGELELAECWASFSHIENASRVSGTATWTFGLAGPGVAAEVFQPDEGESNIRCYPIAGASRPSLLVAWLGRLGQEFHRDVVMLAVEQVITGHGLSGIHSRYFDGNGSDTDECDLWIDTGGQEEEFLRRVGRAGRRDAIDAVTKPRSHAARDRRYRLQE